MYFPFLKRLILFLVTTLTVTIVPASAATVTIDPKSSVTVPINGVRQFTATATGTTPAKSRRHDAQGWRRGRSPSMTIAHTQTARRQEPVGRHGVRREPNELALYRRGCFCWYSALLRSSFSSCCCDQRSFNTWSTQPALAGSGSRPSTFWYADRTTACACSRVICPLTPFAR